MTTEHKYEFVWLEGGHVWHRTHSEHMHHTACGMVISFFGEPKLASKLQAVIRTNEIPLDMCKTCLNYHRFSINPN